MTQVWKNSVNNETIQNCFIKSTIIKQPEVQTKGLGLGYHEDLHLRSLYNEGTTKLADPIEDAQVMPLDEFLNPSGENDADEPDQSDIILHISDGIECVNHNATMYQYIKRKSTVMHNIPRATWAGVRN